MFTLEKKKDLSLPFIPLKAMIALPNNILKIEVGREKSLNAIIESEEKSDDYIVLGYQHDVFNENPNFNEISKFACVAKITMKIKMPNKRYKIKCKLLDRVKLNSVNFEGKFLVSNFDIVDTVKPDSEEEQVLSRMIITEVMNAENKTFANKNELTVIMQQGKTSEELSDRVAFDMKITAEKKLRYLEEADLNKRMKFILEDLETEKYLIEVEQKITSIIKKNIDENQKEYYLREKLRAIHDELGDKVKKESDIEALRKRIKESNMPKDIETKALAELNKYKTLPQASGESGVTRNYIDWLLDIPWSAETTDEQDIKKIEDKLSENHYGLKEVKDRIVEYMAVKNMTNKTPPTILCLVGPPGVGKTSLSKSIASALNRNFVKVALGGVKDESEIRGHRRTYLGAMPGRILQSMKKAKVINPVFLLDEIDKMSSDYKGDPSSAMLEVLDPEQNKIFSDHYLEENYDLSKVLFIATANYIGNIPQPLKDRMEIVNLSSYTEFEKLNIANNYLINRQLELHGLSDYTFTFDDGIILSIIQYYTRESGVRQLERLIGKIVRKSVKKILKDKTKTINITDKIVIEYLGERIFTHNIKDEEDEVGVVNGLAYTQFGGDILPIEVTYFKGSGKMQLTGQLGDVMKESAMAALSYVRSNTDEFEIDADLFKNNDIHIHVPEGAVPKDGPSAGVAMSIAIISALTNKKINKEVGMTGEVTLRGKVLPIGGLKEKSISAHRSGLKTIIIPQQNEKDVKEIPKDVRDNLKIITVKKVTEVIEHIFK